MRGERNPTAKIQGTGGLFDRGRVFPKGPGDERAPFRGELDQVAERPPHEDALTTTLAKKAV